jgi:hypothetical protein
MTIQDGQKFGTKRVLAGIQPRQGEFAVEASGDGASGASHTRQTSQKEIVQSSAFFSFPTKRHKTGTRI